MIYDRLLRRDGAETARLYLSANLEAIDMFERLCAEIECDFEKLPAYVYTRSDCMKIEREVEAVNRLGFPAEFCEHTTLPFKIAGAIRFPEQAQFNPLRFIAGISRGLKIYENTFVREITPHGITTGSGKITAKKIIVATHFPFINKHGSYFLKLYQHRSYVTAYRNCAGLDGMYIDEQEGGLSFRNYGDFLLIGGGGHRTGKKGEAWQKIQRFAQRYYPQAKAEYSWAAQDCKSLDGIPYIGRYSARTPDLYVATGFNKWGMTSAMAAALLLRDFVLGKENPYATVFSPQRSMLRPQLLINGIEACVNLLTPLPRRCPHMGCALKWNPAEHSWDCPCHGSRFTEDGVLIDNPATGNANLK